MQNIYDEKIIMVAVSFISLLNEAIKKRWNKHCGHLSDPMKDKFTYHRKSRYKRNLVRLLIEF